MQQYSLLGTTLLGTDTVYGPHPLIFPAAALKKYRRPLVNPAANTLVPLLVPDAATSREPQTLEKSARDDHSTVEANQIMNKEKYLSYYWITFRVRRCNASSHSFPHHLTLDW